jgi:putative heme-binding domain-containing protein
MSAALRAFLIFAACASVSFAQSELTETQRNAIALEALSRLHSADLTNNPSLRPALDRLLNKSRGTDKFLDIVKQFHLKDHDEGLLELAIKDPAGETGVEAMRVLLAHKNTELIRQSLEGADVKAGTKTAEVLGNAAEQQAVALLLPIAMDAKRDASFRKACVRSLARTSEGATALLDLAKKGTLAEELKFTTSTELNGVRWKNIQAEAARVLPAAMTRDARPLPPVAELLSLRPDASNGERLFYRQQPGCATCHTVHRKGGQVGPDLSEIGTKLAREAIIEAILEPSAGISVGYETYSLDLKSGDEAYGLLVSDSVDDIAIKDAKGIVTHYKKADVVAKRKLKVSLMPTGLQQGMSAQEFADLVGFLAGLKKP